MFRMHAVWLIAGWLCCFTSPAHAQTTVTKHVTWNLDALAGSPAGPFMLNFQLIDGLGVAGGNASVTVSNAPFAGFTLTDGSFLAQVNRPITPVLGERLEFDLSFAYDPNAGDVPDQFSFAVLDNLGWELPTTGPADASATFDLTRDCIIVNTFAGDPGRTPEAGGPGIALAAPVITGESCAVPEPGSLFLLAPTLAGLFLISRRGRSASTPPPDSDEAS